MPADAKTVALRRKPMPDAALEVLAAMVDDGVLLLTSSNWKTGRITLLAGDGRGRASSDTLPFRLNRAVSEALRARGYVVRGDAEKLEKDIRARAAAAGRPPRTRGSGEPIPFFQWSDLPHVATEEGRAALEEERGRLAEIREARRLAAERPRLVVAARAHYGERLPGAGSLLRVMRETEGRFYVEFADSDGSRAGGNPYDGVVKGTGSERWIEKADVVALDVAPENWRAMRRATEDFEQSAARAKSQAEEEIAPILRRAAERREQLLAQLEDEMREAMGAAPAPAPGR